MIFTAAETGALLLALRNLADDQAHRRDWMRNVRQLPEACKDEVPLNAEEMDALATRIEEGLEP